jgi:hypothetical protein
MRIAGVHSNVDVASDATLAEIAADLRVIDNRSGWSRTLAIGELVLKHFFCGNIQEWRARRRDKEASFRRLALRSDCPLGRSALSESVGVYVACRELPLEGMRDHLSPSHVAAVLKLDSSKRLEVLERAVKRRLTVREVRVEVSGMRKREGERRGRPRSSSARLALTFVKRAGALLSETTDLLHRASKAEPDAARQLDAAFAQTEQHLAGIRDALDEHADERAAS